MQHVGVIIDVFYKNYSKEKFEQLSLKQLAAKLEMSVVTITKVRDILAKRQVLIVEGERRNQKCYWNTARCKPNEHLLLDVYKEYTKDAKSRVKVEKKSKRLSSIEQAMLVFKKEGWDKVTLSKTVGYVYTEQTTDLSGVGE
jgi:hypothetical protein